MTDAKRAALELAYFSGLGALIVFLGAIALGRLSVRSKRDIAYAQRPVAVVDRRRGTDNRSNDGGAACCAEAAPAVGRPLRPPS